MLVVGRCKLVREWLNLHIEISVSGPCLVQIGSSTSILARPLLFFILTKEELLCSLDRLSVLLLH